ncbi:MAG: protein kinase, partial [Lacisediminihabitans sp.]
METVGGYRLVRRLGEGDRAEVWLGHATRHEERVAAIKVYRETTPDDQIDIELDALTRADSPHLLRLLDVGTAPDGRPCLILPRLGGSLARTLGARDTVRVGELVTATAPLIEAVRELRRVGIVHGAIGPATVLLDELGAPVIAGFGYARVVGPSADGDARLTPAERDADPGLTRDLYQLGRMIETLAVRAADRQGLRPPGVDELIAWLTAPAAREVRGEDFLDELGGRLFDLAPAIPISLAIPIGLARPTGLVDEVPTASPGATRQIPVSAAPAVGHGAAGGSRLDWLDDRFVQHVD